MEPSFSDALIVKVASTCPNSAIMIYEMIEPHDAFGRTMIDNINQRGCPLLSIYEYPTLASQIQRYQTAGFGAVEGYTMLEIYRTKVDANER
jgi:hypothetical protein